MNDLELDALTIRLVNSSSKEIKDNLLHGRYKSEEVPYIEGYLPYKIEEERNIPVTMYHRRKAPEGTTFKAYEVPAIEKKGWVDSPVKFKKGIRECSQRIVKIFSQFWLLHWKFIIVALIALISAIAALISAIK